MPLRLLFFGLLCLNILAPQAKADSLPRDSIAVDYVQGLPAGKVPGQDPWPAIRIEYDLVPSPWGWELGYAYRGKQYYSFDHDRNRWSSPLPWFLVDAGGVKEADWPFFQTRHVLSPGLLFRLERSWAQPRIGLGVLAQFYFASDAAEFYSDYSREFLRFRSQVQTIVGNYLKFGLEGYLLPFVTWGTDFVFEIPNWSVFYSAVQTYPAEYARTNAHFELRLGVRW